jgi:hypothetical protein
MAVTLGILSKKHIARRQRRQRSAVLGHLVDLFVKSLTKRATDQPKWHKAIAKRQRKQKEQKHNQSDSDSDIDSDSGGDGGDGGAASSAGASAPRKKKNKRIIATIEDMNIMIVGPQHW